MVNALLKEMATPRPTDPSTRARPTVLRPGAQAKGQATPTDEWVGKSRGALERAFKSKSIQELIDIATAVGAHSVLGNRHFTSDRAALRDALVDYVVDLSKPADSDGQASEDGWVWLTRAPSSDGTSAGAKKPSTDSLLSLLSTPADCEELSVQYHAALLSLCRLDAAALHVSRPRVDRVDRNKLELEYTSCYGDACTTQRLQVPLQPPLTALTDVHNRMRVIAEKALFPPMRLLLLQPIALLAVFGMVLLSCCCYIEGAPILDMLLSLVGGRAGGRWVLFFAWVAHAAEAVFAVVTGSKHKMPARPLCGWAGAVLLVGYPCLGKLLALYPAKTSQAGKLKV